MHTFRLLMKRLLIAAAIAAPLSVLTGWPQAAADTDQALARKLRAAGTILPLETIAAKSTKSKSSMPTARCGSSSSTQAPPRY